MEVGQARNDKPAGKTGKGQFCVLIRQAGKNAGGFALNADKEGVGRCFQGFEVFTLANVALYDEICACFIYHD
jgi:hypothetical protein